METTASLLQQVIMGSLLVCVLGTAVYMINEEIRRNR